ncbi:DUF2867 domain-containing protein [Actinomadura madurae]|uniref:DUF2867 domain-containing protein n=1 Tax=Actinomadura madurae TaxID=1993 RepID=UPI00399BE89C
MGGAGDAAANRSRRKPRRSEGRTDAPPERLWEVVEGIGGEHGWYSFPIAWRAWGLLDRLVGGGAPGPAPAAHQGDGGLLARRGDRDRAAPAVAHRKRLAGWLAWLELRVSEKNGRSLLEQRALFHPRGLAGHTYWWALRPFHDLIFGGCAAASPGLPVTGRDRQEGLWRGSGRPTDGRVRRVRG